MTIIDLARRMLAMRVQQRAYFRTRSTFDLEQSKQLEREIDKLIAEIIEDKPGMLPMFEQDLEENR